MKKCSVCKEWCSADLFRQAENETDGCAPACLSCEHWLGEKPTLDITSKLTVKYGDRKLEWELP